MEKDGGSSPGRQWKLESCFSLRNVYHPRTDDFQADKYSWKVLGTMRKVIRVQRATQGTKADPSSRNVT